MVTNRVVGKKVRETGISIMEHFRRNKDLYTLGGVGFAFGFMLGTRTRAPRTTNKTVINVNVRESQEKQLI